MVDLRDEAYRIIDRMIELYTIGDLTLQTLLKLSWEESVKQAEAAARASSGLASAS